MVTEVPTGPEVGDRLLMPGVTVKLTPLLALPFTTTSSGPDLAPLGTVTVMLLSLQLLAVATTPGAPITTSLDPWLLPKFEPLIVTGLPTGPEVGDKLLITGAGAGVPTVKLVPLLAKPFTVTTTSPEVAPLGTGT